MKYLFIEEGLVVINDTVKTPDAKLALAIWGKDIQASLITNPDVAAMIMNKEENISDFVFEPANIRMED